MPFITRSAKRQAIAAGENIQHQQLPPAHRPRQNIPPLIIPPLPELLPDIPPGSFLDQGPIPQPGQIGDHDWDFDTHRSTNYIFDIFDTYIANSGALVIPGTTATEAFERLPTFEDYEAEMLRRAAPRLPPQIDPAQIVSINFLRIFSSL